MHLQILKKLKTFAHPYTSQTTLVLVFMEGIAYLQKLCPLAKIVCVCVRPLFFSVTAATLSVKRAHIIK